MRIRILTRLAGSSQVSQLSEKVNDCVPLEYTWMDNELIVSMDAVVHGELVVHRAALMQNACHPESTQPSTEATF